MKNDDRKPKLTMVDLEPIFDAARYLAELFDRLEDAYYRRRDMILTCTLVEELLQFKKQSIKKESIQ